MKSQSEGARDSYLRLRNQGKGVPGAQDDPFLNREIDDPIWEQESQPPPLPQRVPDNPEISPDQILPGDDKTDPYANQGGTARKTGAANIQNGPEQGQEPNASREDTNQQNARAGKARRIADDLKQKFEEKVTKRFVAAIVRIWAWIAGLLGGSWSIILVVVILAMAIGMLAFSLRFYKSGAGGQTPTTPAMPIDNKSVIEATLLAVKDPEIQKQSKKELTTKLQLLLTQLKEETTDQNIKNEIDSALTKVNQAAAGNVELGQEIFDAIKNVLQKIDNSIPAINGHYPIEKAKIIGTNSELHTGTPLRPTTPSDDLGHGTYIYFGQNKCDGVDLYTTEGNNVYPGMIGEVIDVSDDGTGHKKIAIQNGDYLLLYANFDPSVVKGQKITDLNKPIGKTVKIGNYSQLHIEMSYCNVCLTTTEVDKIDHNQNESKDWGDYLWSRIKYALSLK